MNAKTDIINIITYKLPFKVVRPIYNEFFSRLSEVHWRLKNVDSLQVLNQYIETIEVLLALTIFHKRFLANLDGAVKFHGRVSKSSEVDTIKMGSFDFTTKEKNKILAVQIQYQQLKEKFNIPDDLVNYTETKDFLSRVLYLFKNGDLDHGRNGTIEDDLPF